MTHILEKIITKKQSELLEKSDYYTKINKNFEEGKLIFPKQKESKKFLSVLKSTNLSEIKLIAEIKKASPSKGALFPKANISKIAKIYEKNGASAISILSDEYYFQGNIKDIASISQKVEIPVLRKDFILDKCQILEAKIAGASAILLMVSVLKNETKIKSFIKYAKKINIDCLVETHSEEEIKIAVSAGAQIVGVNSRDFSDLSIDLNRLPPLLEKIPKNIVRVAESGIYTPEDIEKLKPYCDAILVGTSFMKTQNYEEIEKLVKIFSEK